MNIGEKIRKLRTEKLMTQAELAGDKVTRNMLCLIEQGKATPSLQTLYYVASKLNVTPAFLLADSAEEMTMTKCVRISDIRHAYKNGNYRICMDLCKKLPKHGGRNDDEIKLIMAETALSLAMEEIYYDRIRSAWSFLDEAVLYSRETIYNTRHIEAECAVLFSYLEILSPSLVSDNLDVDAVDFNLAKEFCRGNELCRYIVAIECIKDENGNVEKYIRTEHNEALAKHVMCKMYMANGEYDKANNALLDILKIDDTLPGVLLYHVFEDLETCCRQVNNVKHARSYSEEKISRLERILNA